MTSSQMRKRRPSSLRRRLTCWFHNWTTRRTSLKGFSTQSRGILRMLSSIATAKVTLLRLARQRWETRPLPFHKWGREIRVGKLLFYPQVFWFCVFKLLRHLGRYPRFEGVMKNNHLGRYPRFQEVNSRCIFYKLVLVKCWYFIYLRVQLLLHSTHHIFNICNIYVLSHMLSSMTLYMLILCAISLNDYTCMYIYKFYKVQNENKQITSISIYNCKLYPR